jgi:hypothetical protein
MYLSPQPTEAPAKRQRTGSVTKVSSSMPALYNKAAMNSGNSVFIGEIFGVEVDLHAAAITRRDALRVLQAALDIGFRQARASISSYCWEGWALPSYDGRLNSPIFAVNSFEARVRVHLERREESRRANGRKGGRPRTCPVAAGSAYRRDQLVEAVVAAEPQAPGVLRVSGPP